jgi:outer membrane protein assembly factor BamB
MRSSTRGAQRNAVLAAALAVVVGIVLSGCLPPPPPPPPPTTLSISTTPGLFPAFTTAVTDFVSRCGDGAPVTVSVEAPNDTAVSVAGEPWATGRFTTTVTRAAGQDFAIIVAPRSKPATTHFVRCLPTDFPEWTAENAGSTGAEWYVTTPLTGFAPAHSIIYDTNGVPVWWGPPAQAIFTTVLPDGNVGSVVNGVIEEHRFDGSLVRSVHTMDGGADGHDLLLLPNGNFVAVTAASRSGVDLSAIGGPANTTLGDHVIEEIDPSDGHVVWSWDVADHIPATAMDPQWRNSLIVNGSAPYDVYHWNSIEDTGDGFIVSFRHLDAVYKIDKASGAIVWKLGGSAEPKSLTVTGDPVFTNGGHFGGQHDARLLADGTLTLHDNGTNLGRAPRALRYQIDENALTATLLETVVDADISTSICCGSARKLASGDWVIGWGGTETGTESVGGVRHTTLSFPGRLVYRLVPIPAGQLSRDALRAGMDDQYAAGAVATTQEAPSGAPMPFPP